MILLIFVFVVTGFYLITRKVIDYSDQSPTFDEVDRFINRDKNIK